MPLRGHPGISEEDLKAAEMLGVLKKSQPNYNNGKRRRSVSDDSNERNFQERRIVKPRNANSSHSGTLLNRMVNNVVTFYDDIKDRRRVASIARLLDDAYEDNYSSSDNETDNSEDDEEGEEEHVAKDHKEEEETEHDTPVILKKEIDTADTIVQMAHNDNTETHVQHDIDNDHEYHNNYSDDDDDDDEEGRVSKRKIISEAIATTRDNLKEYKLNMSIESKKRLITCLHLLKLANKQLSDKVNNLQVMVKEEQEVPRRRRRTITNSHDRHGHIRNRRPRASTVSGSRGDVTSIAAITNAPDETDTPNHNSGNSTTKKQLHNTQSENYTDENGSSRSGSGSDNEGKDYYGGDEDEEFFDAFDSNDFDEKSTVIKMEVVGTIKKVYALISSYTGDSLPEPARSQVRESLLNLPTNWFLSASNTYGNTVDNQPTSGTSSVSMSASSSSGSNQPVQEIQKLGSSNSGTKGMAIENINNTINRTRSSSSAVNPGADGNLTANGKVLILAKESLDMVQNVMDVVDSTLGKAEEWVKQKQEVKEMFLKSLLEKQRLKELTELSQNPQNTEDNSN